MTVAAVDRLVDHSRIIQINGDSYRRKRARLSAPDQASIGRQLPRLSNSGFLKKPEQTLRTQNLVINPLS